MFKYLKNDPIRMLMFLIGCMGTRFGLSYLLRSNTIPTKIAPVLSAIMAVMGLGFLYIYGFGLRKSGLETSGKEIWWNDLRPLHGLLYILAGWYLYNGNSIQSSNIILADTIIGLTAWFFYHYNI